MITEAEVFQVFKNSALEILEQAINDIDELRLNFSEKKIYDIFSAIHTVKGESTFFGLDEVANVLHQLEDEIHLWKERKYATENEIERFKKNLIFAKSRIKAKENPELSSQENFVEEMNKFFEEYSKALGKKAYLELKINGDIKPSEIAKIMHIFVNLIRNALEHAFSGREGGNVKFFIEKEGNKVKIHYEDDGVGFSPDILEKIKKEGFSAIVGLSSKPASLHSGRGMGLFSIHKLVSEKKGGIIIQNKNEGGSYIFIYYYCDQKF
jgi:chemotaxis protein histidine kinase CheA